jgi:hypothetical protein
MKLDDMPSTEVKRRFKELRRRLEHDEPVRDFLLYNT